MLDVNLRPKMMRIRPCIAVMAAIVGLLQNGTAGTWGRLANPDFDGASMKTTLFFPGQARDGTSPYECSITDQTSLYTVHPSDSRHLAWSTSVSNRAFALEQMTQAGINVVQMSFWGEDFLPCSSSWAAFAPMQDSPKAQDELFASATGRPLLILPFIESRGDWAMRYEFPTSMDGQVAPGLVSQIRHLIRRFLQNSSHPEWAGKWARLYNRNGEARYAISLLHASSDRLSGSGHQAFAAGFDTVADAVEASTGVKVGFLLDTLPPGTFAPGAFRPSPEQTGPYMANTRSVLAINCFVPEIWVGITNTTALLQWKRDFLQRWQQTGLPVLVDVSPGYDAHLVFGSQAAPAYGYSAEWREGLTQLVHDFGMSGIAYNSWNGYTEGMAGMPTLEHGSAWYDWLARLSWTLQTGVHALAGPFTNSANGHLYYLLSPGTWAASEREARAMGGHLATVNDLAEQSWIYSRFGSFGAVQRHLWIGLYDANATTNSSDRVQRQKEFVWIGDTSASYRNWSPFEPSNSGGKEQAVHLWYPGDPFAARWNDADANATNLFGAPLCGVVEVDPLMAGREARDALPTTPPEVAYVPGSAQKIAQLVGDSDRERSGPTANLTFTRYRLSGTDLGIPFRHNGRNYLLFGDSHGGRTGDRDAIAYSTDNNLADGLDLTFLTDSPGLWQPITIPGITQGAFEVPTEGVSVNGRMYVYHTTDHSILRPMGRSVLAVSSDNGATFSPLYTVSTQQFINISIVRGDPSRWPGTPSVSGDALFIFGSGDYRASHVRLAFQPTDGMDASSSLRYLAGLDEAGVPIWSPSEADAVPLFDQPSVGEFSVAHNAFLGRWLMLYNCASPRGINFRTAANPWGPWSDPQVLFEPWVDGGYCHFIHTSWAFWTCDSVHDTGRQNEWGGEYGPYLFEDAAEGTSGSSRVYFTLSTWNPYTVVLMRADLVRQPQPEARLLVPMRTTWRYLDDGSDPGSQWRLPTFDDITWKLGSAELGYGDGDERTSVKDTATGSRRLTTYFRRAFRVNDLASLAAVRLQLLRDDGAVVYINGKEVLRSNLPPGPVTHQTRAVTAIDGTQEKAYVTASVSLGDLVDGENLVAVELHQSDASDGDASFDLELSARLVPPTITLEDARPHLALRWPAAYAAHVLESTIPRVDVSGWQTVAEPRVIQDGNFSVTVQATNEARFFRLRRE